MNGHIPIHDSRFTPGKARLRQSLKFFALLNRFSIPALVWIIISTILLTLPGSAFPKENWLNKIGFDKWVHIAMFGIMVILFCWAIYKSKIATERKRGLFIWTAFACIVYGIAMEFVQQNFIPNRSFDVYDIVADAAGSVIGVVFSIRRFIKK